MNKANLSRIWDDDETLWAEAAVVGLMSGTSMDGVDAAALMTDGQAGLKAGGDCFTPYPASLQKDLAQFMQDIRQAEKPWALARALFERGKQLEANLTHRNAEAVAKLVHSTGQQASLVGFHGQTVLHRPDLGWTWQLGDGQQLANMLGVPVVYDFRSQDMQAGGQGAPLAPAYHRALVECVRTQDSERTISTHIKADIHQPVAIVNIGGVANVSWVGASGVFDMGGIDEQATVPTKNVAQQFAALTAFDTGPGGAQLDDWVRSHTQHLPAGHTHAGLSFDKDGSFSKDGRVLDDLIKSVLARPFYAQPAPKSLDRQDAFVSLPNGTSLEDGAATLAALTAASIAAARQHFPQPVSAYFVCGGGRHNPTLMRFLRESCDEPVLDLAVLADGFNDSLYSTNAQKTLKAGRQGNSFHPLLDGDMVEARLMAYLAVRSVRGLPLSWPTTTGCRAPTLGGILCLPA